MTENKLAQNSVRLFSVGSFGRAVAHYLRVLQGGVFETNIGGNTLPFLDADGAGRITIVAAWRPVPSICELLDGSSHRLQRPFVPLVVDTTTLRLGPIVVPGRGSCWNCWQKRFLQHASWPDEQSALLQFYSSHWDVGPQGYLEPFAMIGATQLSHAIDSLNSSTAVPGYVWEIDILSRETRISSTTGLHNCPRCGLHRPMATSTFSDMQVELTYLWSGVSHKELRRNPT